MAQSTIEWTESTWNPVTGCSKVSPGCRHCYAERMAKRLSAMGQPNYSNGFDLTLHPHMLQRPLEWKKPQTVFVNSMSDLLHEDVPNDYIMRVFDVMRRAHWHVFQVLTKRAERLAEVERLLDWPRNVWMGVSIENQHYTWRANRLMDTHAAVKFLSVEPMLGPISNLPLNGVDWVIVGGESGPGARPLDEKWVLDVRDQCLMGAVPFFFKQWGGTNKKAAGRALQGRTWEEVPLSKSVGLTHL